MEDEPEFHGRGLTPDEYARAMAELGLDPAALDAAHARRGEPVRRSTPAGPPHACRSRLDAGHAAHLRGRREDRQPLGVGHGARRPRRGATRACRSPSSTATSPMSVKTDGVREARTRRLRRVRGGGAQRGGRRRVRSRHAGVLTFWADFGVFGIDEVYNQQRLERHQRRRPQARRHPLRPRRGRGRQDAPVPRLRRRAARLLRLEGDRAGRSQPDRPRRSRRRCHAGQRRRRDGPQQAAGDPRRGRSAALRRGLRVRATGTIDWAREGAMRRC